MTDAQTDLFDQPDGQPSEYPSSADHPTGQPTGHPDVDLGRFSFDPVLTAHLIASGLSRGRVRLAGELVEMEPGLLPEERRALFMAVIIGLEAQAQGSTFVPLPSAGDYFAGRLRALIPKELAATSGWEPAELASTLQTLTVRDELYLMGRDDDWKPLVVSDERLYHQRMMLHEMRLVEALAERLGSADRSIDAEQLEAAFNDLNERQPLSKSGDPIELNDEQHQALSMALRRPLTLITGGPGTGKTSIVVSILRMLLRLGTAPQSIALAAPTGKAANRMAESIYDQLDALDDPAEEDRRLFEDLEKPRTLHRLMGYSPRRDRFNHHAENPLPHQMVIVDEASMIDLFLMEHLLRAVADDAQLLLLGDADQLPSVDTGAVLRDLIPKAGDDEAPTAHAATRLQTSYRMRAEDPAGRQILSFAQAVRDYDESGQFQAPETFSELSKGADFPDGLHLWQPAMDAEGQPKLGNFTDWWFSELVLGGDEKTWSQRLNHAHGCDAEGMLTEDARRRVRRLLRHYDRARILTLTRVFSTGSEQLNAAFHRATAALGQTRLEAEFDFHPGEPVMMLRNDYDRNLFNGDQGVVVWCEGINESGERDLSLMAVFDRAGELITYPLTELRDDLEHAFAMTVHKAQGSEFERVAMVLPGHPMPLLNRELLYTGLTRASRGVLIVGKGELLETGAANRSERFSAVGEKLKQY